MTAKLQIRWFGHSCFRISSASGAKILTDPFDESVGSVSYTHLDVYKRQAGTLDSITAMSKEAILDYFHAFYHPGNIIVSVAGNISKEEVNRVIAGFFQGRESHAKKTFAPVDVKDQGPSVRVENRDTKQANIVLGFPGYPRLHPARYALELLDVVLGEGMSSRLFQEVRVERGLAYLSLIHI